MFVIFQLSNNPQLGCFQNLICGTPVLKLNKYRTGKITLDISPDVTFLDLMFGYKLNQIAYNPKTKKWLLHSISKLNSASVEVNILHLDHLDKLMETA